MIKMYHPIHVHTMICYSSAFISQKYITDNLIILKKSIMKTVQFLYKNLRKPLITSLNVVITSKERVAIHFTCPTYIIET